MRSPSSLLKSAPADAGQGGERRESGVYTGVNEHFEPFSNAERRRPSGFQQTASKQTGSSLFVALVMLALLMILGTSTINSSMLELRAAGNTKQMVDGFQRADSGVSATMALVGTTENPFNGSSVGDPFTSFAAANKPLKNIASVGVDVSLQQAAGTCPRSEQASSTAFVSCEYYEVRSQHATAGTATATVRQGVSREVISN